MFSSRAKASQNPQAMTVLASIQAKTLTKFNLTLFYFPRAGAPRK
jgi:hypothetical protein